MKKLIVLILFLLLFISGCNIDENNHIHTYNEEWTYDDFYHYHYATCGHDITKDEGEHQFIEEVIKEATHSKEGMVEYTCIECGYTRTETIEVINHKFSEEYS